jgi:cobalt-zinc-cadmium efflux system outer membrane protein
VLGAQRRLDLAEQALATARQVVATVGELVRAGETSPIEEVRARGEEGLASADVEAARHELDLARSRLARLWGAEEADFALAAGELDGGQLPEQERLLSLRPSRPRPLAGRGRQSGGVGRGWA